MGRRGGAGPASGRWSGAAVAEARARIAPLLPMPCHRCRRPVLPTQEWVVGHLKSRAAYPELTFEPSNQVPEHRSCSNRSAQQAVIEKAKREAVEEERRRVANGSRTLPSSSVGPPPEPPPLREYLPEVPGRAAGEPGSPLEDPGFPRYNPESLAGFDWLEGFLEAPEEASHPLAMTPPHPRAVGSLGHQAIEWIETHVTEMGRPIKLYWWQRLAIVRQLEVDADGKLVWRVVVESCPRRAGKSVRLRVMALWRMAHAELLGEEQQVIHVARDMNIVREILRGAFDWAEARDWTVRKANGKEEIEAPDGSRWLARSVHATTGYSPGLALADECWDIEPGVIDEGLEPATMKRLSPQLVLTSTAHRRATSLMKGRIARSLQAIASGEQTNTLLMLWAAPPGADPSEESTWRAASPHWSPEDRDFIRDKYEAALAGQDDPDSDDPDPMEGFLAQYCNRWRLKAARTAPGNAVVKEQEWEGLAAPVPEGPPAGVAIEGWYRDGVSVARAWFAGGRVTVSVSDHRDVPDAIAAAAAAGCPNPIRVGKSLTGDPALQPLWHESMQGTTKSAVADLRRLIDDGALAHDGSTELARQVLALRVSPSADGVTIRSKGRADSVKAAVWAAEAARNAPEPAAIW